MKIWAWNEICEVETCSSVPSFMGREVNSNFPPSVLFPPLTTPKDFALHNHRDLHYRMHVRDDLFFNQLDWSLLSLQYSLLKLPQDLLSFIASEGDLRNSFKCFWNLNEWRMYGTREQCKGGVGPTPLLKVKRIAVILQKHTWKANNNTLDG